MHLPSQIAPLLVSWYASNARDLPWRKTRDPYHVWLSEIMLQQTRAETVKSFYERFISVLPSVYDLASAHEQLLLWIWEGLGYYTRVRNLQKAAEIIVNKYDGCFPRTPEEWIRLPGIGPYTAGAICSICFGLPTPAVDTNVLRVITRLCAYQQPIDRSSTKKAVYEALARIYPDGYCGDFTQALMDLGAIVCLPNGAPDCLLCPLNELCVAQKTGLWTKIPVKTQKKPRRVDEITVFLFLHHGKLAFLRRPEKGLLAGQWELPNVQGAFTPQYALDYASSLGLAPEFLRRQICKKHIFTHIQWNMTAYYIDCGNVITGFEWAAPREHPLPTAFRVFVAELENEGCVFSLGPL